MLLFQTPIGQAIKAGDVDTLNQLVKEGENILYRDRVMILSSANVL